MKKILTGVALATFTTSLGSAESQRNKESRAPAIHLKRQKQRVNYRRLYLDPRKSIQPMLNPDSEQGLCSTAHDFRPGYFGNNG
jgi:hypothetical protein